MLTATRPLKRDLREEILKLEKNDSKEIKRLEMANFDGGEKPQTSTVGSSRQKNILPVNTYVYGIE